jgi:hypothetical protein
MNGTYYFATKFVFCQHIIVVNFRIPKHFWRQNSNLRKIEIQILSETEVCQFRKTISASVLKSFPHLSYPVVI